MLRSWNEIKQNVPRKGKRLRQNPGPGKPYSIHLLQASWVGGEWDEWWMMGVVIMCQDWSCKRRLFCFWVKKHDMGLFEKKMISTLKTARFERKTKFWDSRKLGTSAVNLRLSPTCAWGVGPAYALTLLQHNTWSETKGEALKNGDFCTLLKIWYLYLLDRFWIFVPVWKWDICTLPVFSFRMYLPWDTILARLSNLRVEIWNPGTAGGWRQ